jgi:plastocyanin
VTGSHHHQHDLRSTTRRAGLPLPRRTCLAIAGAVSVAALVACGSSSSTQEPPASATSAASAPAGGDTSPMVPASSAGTSSTAQASQPAAQPAVITIDKFAYTVPASVSPGAMITVVNEDEEAHTVTADSQNAFDDKATAGASTRFQAPSQPGSYPFHCTYHSNMHGVLVVK